MTREQMKQVADSYTFEKTGFAPYDGWTGCNHGALYGNDLKQAILSELKKHGVKATARQGRGGYTTRFTFTIKTPAKCFLSAEDYYKTARNYGRDWYCLPNGNYIHHRDMNGLAPEKYESVVKYTCKREYEEAKADHSDRIVIPEFTDMVQQIVDSFNSDHSNAMIDYFDRSFYASYEWKEG